MREVTEWDSPTPNHVYVFDNSMNNIIAYVPAGSNIVQKFKIPISIDRRGRKFVELKD